MKNYSFFLLIISATLLFSACKKESDQVDIAAVRLTVEDIIITDSTSSDFNHRLQGTIISPNGIPFDEYGFFLKKGAYIQFLKIGAGMKVGNVETEHLLPMRLVDNDVTLYAIVNGDTLKSKDVIFTPDFTQNPSDPVPVSIAPTGTDGANTPGFESFIVNVFNYDTVNYAIVGQGVEFALTSDYFINPVYNFFHLGVPVFSDFTITNLYMTFPQTYFLPETDYNYRAFVLVNRKGTSDQVYVYGNHNNFKTKK